MNERARVSERIFESCCGNTNREQHVEADASSICPMSGMCGGFARRIRIGVFLAVAGILMVGLGVLLLAEPKVLTWLFAGAVIAMGAAALFGAVATRRRGIGPTRP